MKITVTVETFSEQGSGHVVVNISEDELRSLAADKAMKEYTIDGCIAKDIQITHNS
jgi:hypothetical protein